MRYGRRRAPHQSEVLAGFEDALDSLNRTQTRCMRAKRHDLTERIEEVRQRTKEIMEKARWATLHAHEELETMELTDLDGEIQRGEA